MKAFLIFLYVLIGYFSLSAQDSTTVTIKSGNRIKDVLTVNDVFSHPQFISGKVYFRDGGVVSAMLNYDCLSDQMLFIGAKGDTLALDAEKTINYIALAKDTFYYIIGDGYVRLLASNSVVKLAEKKVWEVSDIKKVGSHNRQANTYAVNSITSVTNGYGRDYNLILDEDVVLRKKAQYYFGNTYNNFVPASKKSLLSFFPKKETVISNYLKENRVDFTAMQDLEKLAQFLKQYY
jgi:hypothetical protein